MIPNNRCIVLSVLHEYLWIYKKNILEIRYAIQQRYDVKCRIQRGHVWHGIWLYSISWCWCVTRGWQKLLHMFWQPNSYVSQGWAIWISVSFVCVIVLDMFPNQYSIYRKQEDVVRFPASQIYSLETKELNLL